MNQVLKPERFDVSPSASNAAKLQRHWLVTFEHFIAAIENENLNKLTVGYIQIISQQTCMS